MVGVQQDLSGMVKDEDPSPAHRRSSTDRNKTAQDILGKIKARSEAAAQAAAQAAAAKAASQAVAQAAAQAAAAAMLAKISAQAKITARAKAAQIDEATTHARTAANLNSQADAASHAALDAGTRHTASAVSLKAAQAAYDSTLADVAATAEKREVAMTMSGRWASLSLASARVVSTTAAAEATLRTALTRELHDLLGRKAAGTLLTAAPMDVQNVIKEDERNLAEIDKSAEAVLLSAGDIAGLDEVHALQVESAAEIDEKKDQAVAVVLARIAEVQALLAHMPCA